MQSGDRKTMNPRDQTVILVAVAIIFVLLAFYPFDGVASFDPLGWFINSVMASLTGSLTCFSDGYNDFHINKGPDILDNFRLPNCCLCCELVSVSQKKLPQTHKVKKIWI